MELRTAKPQHALTSNGTNRQLIPLTSQDFPHLNTVFRIKQKLQRVKQNMASTQLSLHHLVRFPGSFQNQEPNSLYPTILALHGRGSNEQDLIELASHLPDDVLWISPRAPLILGPDSYEWYRVRVIGRPDPEQVVSALETIDHFIDEILSIYPVDPQKLFLLGFNQGIFFPCAIH
jgi:predicted peptidase